MQNYPKLFKPLQHLTLCLFLALSSASLSEAAWAGGPIEKDMKKMGKQLKKAFRSDNLDDLGNYLRELRHYAESAKNRELKLPKKLGEKKIASITQDYKEGMDKLMSDIDAALAAVKASKEDEARALLKQIKDVKDKYHDKLGVED